MRRLLVATARIGVAPLTVVVLSLSVAMRVTAAPRPQAESHWNWCNTEAVTSAPAVVWTRLKSATAAHGDLPPTYWSDVTYRDDIAKLICYESTFRYLAEDGSQYGWFQMSGSLVRSEGVRFTEYLGGSVTQAAGWYQCTAGERYIAARYGNPAAAWSHEESYGWY